MKWIFAKRINIPPSIKIELYIFQVSVSTKEANLVLNRPI